MARLVLCLLCAVLAVPARAQCDRTVTDVQFAGPIMDPVSIPKWVAKLPNPLHPSNIFTPDRVQFGPSADYFKLGMRQITQQVLPPGCPTTQVWAYGNAADPMNNPVSFSSPSKTIVAFKNRPTYVQWVHNQMPTTHLFNIDRTFHCGSAANCTPDVRTVAHLHGGHVPASADGFPEAWQSADGLTSGRSFNNSLYSYPNDQDGTTLWFHDHAVGITRLNVYAGLAGFYIVRGTREISLQAVNLIPRYPYDVPIVIQVCCCYCSLSAIVYYCVVCFVAPCSLRVLQLCAIPDMAGSIL